MLSILLEMSCRIYINVLLMSLTFCLPDEIFVAFKTEYDGAEDSASKLFKYIVKTNFHELVSQEKIYSLVQLRVRALACKAFADVGLSDLNHVVYSFSHKKCASAVCWSTAHGVTDIGIDIEPVGNYLQPKASKFFLNKYDQLFDTSLLEAWVLKEAAYKCIDRFQFKYILTDIKIRKIGFSTYVAKVDGYSCKCMLVRNNLNYVMAVAWRTQQI